MNSGSQLQSRGSICDGIGILYIKGFDELVEAEAHKQSSMDILGAQLDFV